MNRFLSVALIALACLFGATVVSAQKTTGTLRGQVLDPSGAVVPDAQVVVTNQETGVKATVTTTSAGTYELPSVLPGLYKIAVEAKGFKGYVRKDIVVQANQDNVADARLELGGRL